jgi:hypothetical protein
MKSNPLKLLGKKVQDVVTGFEGIAESVTFDLYGCVQAIVRPRVDKKTGATREPLWFDVKRLKVLVEKPILSPPTGVGLSSFQEQGPADKPPMRRTPAPR